MKKVLFLAVAALAFVACANNQAAEEVEAIDSTAVEVAPVEEVLDSTAAVVEDVTAEVVETVEEVTK